MDEFLSEILGLIRSNLSDKEIKEGLSHYHDSDIAEVIPLLSEEEKHRLYKLLDIQELSDILPYVEDIEEAFDTIPAEKAADIIELMDADDAVDVLQELDDSDRENIINLMEEEAANDAKLILSYDEDQVGSKMTTNFVTINRGDSVKVAMRKVIQQASENDNISTIFVLESNSTVYGTLALKDLICARPEVDLNDLIMTAFPSVYAEQEIDDVITDLKSYSEDSVAVLSKDEVLIGVITASDIIEAVDDALGEDYSKLAGLTKEEDLNESVFKSMKKRIPWLVLLLVLGFIVSFLISGFEVVIASLPIIVFFQSLVLDMAGNTGTQSLAVTIRVLSDHEMRPKLVLKLVLKEFRVGLCNGLVMGSIGFIFVFLYLFITKGNIVPGTPFLLSDCFLASGIVGISLLCAMLCSTAVGTIIPLFFKKIKVDPAVASGPLITTINDIVAICCYYGFAMILFAEHIH